MTYFGPVVFEEVRSKFTIPPSTKGEGSSVELGLLCLELTPKSSMSIKSKSSESSASCMETLSLSSNL